MVNFNNFRSLKLIGGVAVAALLSLAILLPLARYLWPVNVSRAAHIPHSPPPRAQHLDENTLLIPPPVMKSLGIATEKVVVPQKPLQLPPLSGCLAVDNNRLVHVHSRFPGEVVALGTDSGYETDSASPEWTSRGRPVRFGDKVRKGQLLAVVWSKDLGEKKSDLVDALSKLKLDQQTLERVKGLATQGALPGRALREAERDVEADLVSVARLERTLRSWRLDDSEIAAIKKEAEQIISNARKQKSKAQEEWARVEIRAPQDGIILEKNVTVGDLVDTTTDLFKVADLTQLAVWAYVYEEDLPQLQKMDLPIRWTIHLPSHPEVKYQGTLERIGQLIDPNQHTALVSGLVDNSEGKLRVGQFISASIALPPSPNELVIPATALVEDGEESLVFVQPDPSKPEFVRCSVKVIRRYQDTVFLEKTPAARRPAHGSQPLQPGDIIVSKGGLLLRDALRQLPVTGAQAPAAGDADNSDAAQHN